MCQPHWMGPIPASKAHHHSSRGGLFTNSLGVAVGALHMSVGRNVTLESTPRNRDTDVLAWHLICFIGGLLHDIGNPLSFRASSIPSHNPANVQRRNWR